MINNLLVPRSRVFNRARWLKTFSENEDLRTHFWINKINQLIDKLKQDSQLKHLGPSRKIKYLDELKELNPIDKATLKQSIDISKYKSGVMSTGGSSGEVFKFPADRKWSEVCRYNNQYARRSFIYNNEKIALVWGHSHLFGGKNVLIKKYIRRFKDGLNRTKRFNAYKTSKNDLTILIKELQRFKPKHIIGYASTIYLLCKHAREHGFLLGFDTVTVTSEYMSTVQAREVSEHFGAIVRQEYGSAEFGVTAYKSTIESNYEVLFDSFFVEVDTDGQILITSFDREIFPFFRYPTGDYLSIKDKSGIISFPDVYGRLNDHLSLNICGQHKKVHSEFFTHALKNLLESGDIFQVIVENNLVNILSSGKINKKTREGFQASFYQEFALKIDINYYEHITRFEKSLAGKHKWIINKT